MSKKSKNALVVDDKGFFIDKIKGESFFKGEIAVYFGGSPITLVSINPQGLVRSALVSLQAHFKTIPENRTEHEINEMFVYPLITTNNFSVENTEYPKEGQKT